jgi:NAD(P)-dependent dehydrogenase (short-subunit alcohol dehydrogenase family)
MSPTVILISGANRGLGEGLLSRYLQRDNHIVIAANRDPSHSSSTALQNLPTGKGSRLIVVKIDASNESDPAEAVKSLTAQGIDYIDMVVANAGVAYSLPKVCDLKIEELQGHLVPNVFGVVWLYQATRLLLEKSTKPIWATMGSTAAWIE